MRNSRRPARDAERRESEIQSTGCDHDPKLLRVRKQKRPPLGAIDYCRKLLYIDRFSSIRWSLLRAIISAMRLQCNVVFCFICTPSVLLSISLIKSVFEKLAFWFYMTLPETKNFQPLQKSKNMNTRKAHKSQGRPLSINLLVLHDQAPPETKHVQSLPKTKQ